MTFLLRFVFISSFFSKHFISFSLSIAPFFNITHRKHLRCFLELRKKHTQNWCETTGFESGKMPKNFINAFHYERARYIPWNILFWIFNPLHFEWVLLCLLNRFMRIHVQSGRVWKNYSHFVTTVVIVLMKIDEPSYSWILKRKLSNRIEWINDQWRQRMVKMHILNE